MPQRILIVGSCGAGKSTLATRLASVHRHPLIHLDQHFWRPGWVEPSEVEWRRRVGDLVAEDRWIMDGNYAGTLDLRLPRADQIVFMDTPRRTTLYRVVRRRVLRNRVDLLDGSPERVTWRFLKYVWRYPVEGRVRLLDAIARHAPDTEVVRLRNRREVDGWLRGMSEHDVRHTLLCGIAETVTPVR